MALCWRLPVSRPGQELNPLLPTSWYSEWQGATAHMQMMYLPVVCCCNAHVKSLYSAIFSVSSGGTRRCADSMPWVKVKARNKSQVSGLSGSLLTIRFLNEFSVKFSPAVLSHIAAECVTEKQEGEK